MAAMMPPDHKVLDNPYGGKGPLVMAVTWAEASVALTLMLLRTYTNAFVVKSWKWDYFWAMFTFITGMVAQAMITVSCIWGLGNHIYLLFGPQLIKANLWSWIGQIVVIQAIGFGKIAVIAFLLRIQDRANSKRNKYLAYMLYFIGISNVIINIDQMILILLQCDPVPKLWNPAIPGTCDHIYRTNNVAYFQGTWAAISDIILAVYPVLFFWDLKISRKIKIGLCFLMAGGLVAAAAGIVKTVNLKLISVEQDITYFIATLVIWAYTECWLVLILGSLPPLRPLFVRVFYSITSSYNRSRSKTTQQYYYGASQNDNRSIPMYPPSNSVSASKGNTTTGDTDSERKILGDMNGPAGGAFGRDGILRTTHVHVHATKESKGDDASSSDSSIAGLEAGVTSPGRAL